MGLDLSLCYIQDHSLRILHHGLLQCSDVTIDNLWLYNNGLTAQSSPLISDIAMKCKVKELGISGNYITGEDQQLYAMLTNSYTMLEQLNMSNSRLSSKGAISLFNALTDNNKLKELNIAINDITDDACDAITTALKKNSCLVKLSMWSNPLTGEAMINLVNDCLKVNKTLAQLQLPLYHGETKKRISSLQEVINKNRKSHGYKLQLVIDC